MEFQHKYLQSIGKCCADCFSFFNKDLMKNKYKYYNTVFNMALFFTVFTMAGVFSSVYARFNIYFEVFSVLLLVWNVNEMVVNSKIPWIKNAAYICYTLYFIYQIVFTYGMGWHTNYQFLLTAMDKYLGYKFLKGAAYE